VYTTFNSHYFESGPRAGVKFAGGASENFLPPTCLQCTGPVVPPRGGPRYLHGVPSLPCGPFTPV